MTWNFPATLPPGGIVRQYVEWTTGIKNWFDDCAEARYQLDGTDVQFEIQARSGRASDGSWGHHLQVYFTNMQTPNIPVGSTVRLGWKLHGQITWVVSGTAPNNLVTSKPPPNWMQANLNILGNRTLRHLCIPASHDAGMSTLSSHTTFSNEGNTLTQYSSVGKQLEAGARWFDIRPVLKGSEFWTGHFSYFTTAKLGWQGGTDQSLNKIIDQVNAFTATNKELNILNISHSYDTNHGYVDINDTQAATLFEQLMGVNNRWVAPLSDTLVDLTVLPLNRFLVGGPTGVQAAVVIVVPLNVSLGTYDRHGFYKGSQFPISSASITNTNYQDVLNTMKEKLSSDPGYFQFG